jgi:hypothetical protein
MLYQMYSIFYIGVMAHDVGIRFQVFLVKNRRCRTPEITAESSACTRRMQDDQIVRKKAISCCVTFRMHMHHAEE